MMNNESNEISERELNESEMENLADDMNRVDIETSESEKFSEEVTEDETEQNKNEKGLLRCPIPHCVYSSDRRSNFSRHRSKLHVNLKKPKECCKIEFNTKFDFDQHRKQNHSNGQYKCEQCGSVFAKLALLNRHDYIHNPQNSLKCINCAYKNDNESNMKRHCKSSGHEYINEKKKHEAPEREPKTPKKQRTSSPKNEEMDLAVPSTSGEQSTQRSQCVRKRDSTPSSSDELVIPSTSGEHSSRKFDFRRKMKLKPTTSDKVIVKSQKQNQLAKTGQLLGKCIKLIQRPTPKFFQCRKPESEDRQVPSMEIILPPEIVGPRFSSQDEVFNHFHLFLRK